MTSVAPELYDAAEVDGASLWGKIWHVTLPQLRGILFITFILQIISTAQVFLQPYLFTGGGPANSTTTRCEGGDDEDDLAEVPHARSRTAVIPAKAGIQPAAHIHVDERRKPDRDALEDGSSPSRG